MNLPTRIWLAAAGVVLAAFVVLLLATPSPISLTGGGLFGEAEPTAVEIAETYIEARNDHDPERARELLADDFSMDGPPAFRHDLSSLEPTFEMHRAFGFNYSDGDCRQDTATPIVVCDYLWTTELHRISGDPPTPTTFRFYLIDGRIWQIHGEPDAHSFYGPFYDDFLVGYPEFHALLDEGFTLDSPDVTREVVELLPHYFELYEEWLSQQP